MKLPAMLLLILWASTGLRGCVNPGLIGIADIHLSGNYAYVSERAGGIQVIDISNPENPLLVGRISGVGRLVKIDGSRAYAFSENSRLQTIDISDPRNARIAGTADVPSIARVFDVSGDLAYAITHGGPSDDIFWTFSIVSPESLEVARRFVLPGYVGNSIVSDGYAYIHSAEEIQVIDIDPIGSMEIKHDVDVPYFPNAMCALDGYVYIVMNAAGMRVIDVDPPESSHIVGTLETHGGFWDVEVDGHYVYITDHTGKFHIVDVSDPASPKIVKTVDVATSYVKVRDGYAYAVSQNGGFKVIDVDPAGSAHVVGSAEVPL